MYVSIDREFYYTADGKPYFFCERYTIVKDGAIIHLRSTDPSHDAEAFNELLAETEREDWGREYAGNLSHDGIYCYTYSQVLED